MARKKLKITKYDASAYLDSEEMIAACLEEALAHDDPELFLAVVGEVAKARGMTSIARESGLGRESLYKAFAPGARPRYETVQKVLGALGVKLTVSPL